MKQVTKYVADDGLEFSGMAECLAYESICRNVDDIMSVFPEPPKLPGCGFANGEGYLQHDPEIVTKARKEILKLANAVMPHKWFEQAIENEWIDPSWPSRLISEMNERCISRAWYRIACMTADGREYGQPYYRTHPEKAKNVCLNAEGVA